MAKTDRNIDQQLVKSLRKGDIFAFNELYELFDLAKDPKHMKLVTEWRHKMIEHLSIRGESWLKDGDLTVHEESQKYSPNDPRYEEYNSKLH